MNPFDLLLHELSRRNVRFAVIGVWGANYWAPGGAAVFHTEDKDLFLPPDPANLVSIWEACEARQLDLWASNEPLDRPRDLWLAERIVAQRALTRATDARDLQVDLTLVMAGYDFEQVWAERRIFKVGDVEVPVARLAHIVESKAKAGRDKDRLFLATHREALRQLMGPNPLLGTEDPPTRES